MLILNITTGSLCRPGAPRSKAVPPTVSGSIAVLPLVLKVMGYIQIIM